MSTEKVDKGDDDMSRKAIISATTLAGAALLSGCDWTSSNHTGNWRGGWSARYEGVTFSGVYRGDNGAPLGVFEETGGARQVTVNNEHFATGNGSRNYSAQLQNGNLVPGSLEVSYDSGLRRQTFADDGDGNLTGDSGGSGTVNYNTGAVTLDAGPTQQQIPPGTAILASYRYVVAVDERLMRLDNLSVEQTGLDLKMRGSNGAVLEGRLGGIRAVASENGGEHIAVEFSARSDFLGQQIRLTGMFSADLGPRDASGSSTMANRRISGTWVARQAGINMTIEGHSQNVAVVMPPEDDEGA